MNTVGTSYGLSWLSGINPYAPLLALYIAARYAPDRFPINPNVAFLKQDYWMYALEMLMLSFQPRRVVSQQWHYPYPQW